MGVFTVGRQVGLEILMPGWWLSGASVDLDFDNGRYYDSANPNTVSLVTDFLTCSRASIGYAKDSGGSWTSFAANQLRITNLGLLVEDARTNNLLNSGSPATQTTASLATGNYTLWVEGSGSALASAGSATITGAASATENNPDTFTVTVAGTVTVTVTGSLTKFQLELGAFPSSFILTTGAAATRAKDLVTFTGNLVTVVNGTAATVLLDIKLLADAARIVNANIIGGASQAMMYLGTGSIENFTSYNGIGSLDTDFTATGQTFAGGVKLGSAGNASTRTQSAGGSSPNSVGNAWNYQNQSFNTASDVYGYYRRFTVWNSKLADATLQTLTAP